ncbi:MAG: hypothetical protein ACW99U_05160 [Candidatus Thorarchaeota archaeon]|jgi:hypothetical protein
MEGEKNVRELFVIHRSGLPLGHVGTGHVEIDDALFGGLLSAIENVGLSLGLEADGVLDAITFQAYDLVYARTESGLVVLLSGSESAEYFARVKTELQAIGKEIETRGYFDIDAVGVGERLSEINSIIAATARTTFARLNDVFIWNEEHTFQLAVHKNERWSGHNLFVNYLLLSPMVKTLKLPIKDMERICDLLKEKRRPSELLNDPNIETKDERRIEDAVRFLHMYDLAHCFGTAIVG